MKRLNISAFFLACLLFLVFEGSAPEQGADHCEVRYAKHPRVFLDVSPIAIQRVLDALYCTFLCTDNVRCLSLNVKVKPGADNNLECRLLDTANYSAPHLLNSTEEFDHYSIRVSGGNMVDISTDCRSIPGLPTFPCVLFTLTFFFCPRSGLKHVSVGQAGRWVENKIVATFFLDSL